MLGTEIATAPNEPGSHLHDEELVILRNRHSSTQTDIRVRLQTSSGTYIGSVTLPEHKKRLSDLLNDNRPFVLLRDVEVLNTGQGVPFFAVQKSTIEVMWEVDGPRARTSAVDTVTSIPRHLLLGEEERRKSTRRRPPHQFTVNVAPGGSACIVDVSETGFLLEHQFQMRAGHIVLMCIGDHRRRALVRACVRHTGVHASGGDGVVYRSGVEFLETVEGLFEALQLDLKCLPE